MTDQRNRARYGPRTNRSVWTEKDGQPHKGAPRRFSRLNYTADWSASAAARSAGRQLDSTADEAERATVDAANRAAEREAARLLR